MELKINTLFYWCNDVGQMREFYSDVLGLTEVYFLNDDKHGWLTYDINGIQVVFIRASHPLPIESAWARQPGWAEGTREAHSMVLQLSLDGFQKVIERAKVKNMTFFDKEPRGNKDENLSHFVMDPMGNTIELYYQAKAN